MIIMSNDHNLSMCIFILNILHMGSESGLIRALPMRGFVWGQSDFLDSVGGLTSVIPLFFCRG